MRTTSTNTDTDGRGGWSTPDHLAFTPAQVALRTMLARHADASGLTLAVIDRLVERVQITHWRAEQPLYGRHDSGGLVHFLVVGAVRLVCGDGDRAVIARIVPPGEFLNLSALYADAGHRSFGAVAHVDSVVASVRRTTLLEAVESLGPARLIRFMAHGMRMLAPLVQQRCHLPTMPLRDRVIAQLRVLAGDFGRPGPRATLIDLPITHGQLSAMIGASRANVTRCLIELRHEGWLRVDTHRFVIAVDQSRDC